MIDKTDLCLVWKDGMVKREARIQSDSLTLHEIDPDGPSHDVVSLDKYQMRQLLRLMEIWDEGNI